MKEKVISYVCLLQMSFTYIAIYVCKLCNYIYFDYTAVMVQHDNVVASQKNVSKSILKPPYHLEFLLHSYGISYNYKY